MVAINSINRLEVWYRDRLVGILGMTTDGRRCTFEYDRAWLQEGFSLSPLHLPLRQELFIAEATPFYGNFGIFEDSLPDGYGRYLLHRVLQRNGVDDMKLSPLQRLSIVGNSGMGALRYIPESVMVEGKSLPTLDALQQMALDVLGEKTTEGADVLYYNSGNSGGCRPKCLLHDEEGHWLVKFRHTYDSQDLGKQEFFYTELARRCGIETSDFRLIEGKYFASRRFDLDPEGKPLYVATAAALLNESINPPSTDYKVLLALTGYLTQRPDQVEQMFRRMVFNILIGNKDDHAKNFSFIYCDGSWSLSPAYDLTRCEQGYNGEHATSCMGNGTPTEDDMIAAATSIRIPAARAKAIIKEMKAVIRIC